MTFGYLWTLFVRMRGTFDPRHTYDEHLVFGIKTGYDTGYRPLPPPRPSPGPYKRRAPPPSLPTPLPLLSQALSCSPLLSRRAWVTAVALPHHHYSCSGVPTSISASSSLSSPANVGKNRQPQALSCLTLVLAVIKCTYLLPRYLHFIQDMEDRCLLLTSSMSFIDLPFEEHRMTKKHHMDQNPYISSLCPKTRGSLR
jgi:hypothetical protein